MMSVKFSEELIMEDVKIYMWRTSVLSGYDDDYSIVAASNVDEARMFLLDKFYDAYKNNFPWDFGYDNNFLDDESKEDYYKAKVAFAERISSEPDIFVAGIFYGGG
jgi:hypothetical protein